MRLTTRSRYGARILVDLARHSKEGPVQSGDISKRQGISVKYLEQLMRPLKKAKYVESVRGAKGGHILAMDPKNITLGQIVRLLEGQNAIIKCLESPESCDKANECQIRLAWKAASEALFEKLDGTTIGELANGTDQLFSADKAHFTERE